MIPVIAFGLRRNGAGSRPSPLGLALFFASLCMLATGAFFTLDGVRIKAKAFTAQVLLDKAWRKTLAGEAAARPWPWADTWPVLMLEAPRLRQKSIVLHGVSGQAMAFGPGLMTGGPAPGEPGLAVISAHRDTHFRFLQDVALDDEILVTGADGAVRAFRITDLRIVEATRSGLSHDGDKSQLALVTCWPFDALRRGPLRFVAIADRVDGPPLNTAYG
ncbi:MAG: class GN sortase [Pseudomonadota bacterium]